MKMKAIILTAALTVGCLCCGVGISASAYTIDDIIRKAREQGISETQIQAGINHWTTGIYTQEELDAIYLQLEAYGDSADEMVDSMFKEYYGDTTPTESEPDRSGSETDSSSDSSVSESNPEPPADSVTSTDFINMTLEEKMAYVNSMSPEDREHFLENLTPAERNSIIKQMSADDQAKLLQGYIDLAKQMGLNVTVDSLTEEGIALTVRDEAGVVVDKSATGIIVDETGISYDGLLAAAAASVILAVSGITWLYRYLCRTDGQMQ